MDNTIHKIYLASPWFSAEQEEAMDSAREIILAHQRNFELFSPKYDGVDLSSLPEVTREIRKKVYNLDVLKVLECDLVVAVLDFKDTGTSFEMGLAARGKLVTKEGYRPHTLDLTQSILNAHMEPIPILAYCHNPQKSLNVMLTEACIGFAQGGYDLALKLDGIEDLIDNAEDWRGGFV